MPDPNRVMPGLNRQDRLSSTHKGLRSLLGLAPNARNGPPSRVGQAKERSAGRASGGTPIDDLLGPLTSMVGGMDGFMPDISALQAQLEKAIAAQYNPMIDIVEDDISDARKRAGVAREEIGDLYTDLTGYYEGQVEPTKKKNEGRKAEAKQNAQALRQSIASDYAQRLQEQVDLYRSLGIQAAAPSATDQQGADQANAMAMAQNIGAAEQSALQTQSNADEAYWSEGAGIAKSEGTAQQSDIVKRLNDYVNEQKQQMAALRGQKEAAYHQGLMQLQSDAAKSASEGQNALWNRLMDLARLRLSAADSGGSGSGRPEDGLTGAMTFLQDTGMGNLSGTFQDYLRAAQTWGNSAQARQYYGGQGPNTPEEWAQVIRDHAANKGLGPEMQNALWQAALRYYNR